jgi:hypothetical protein
MNAIYRARCRLADLRGRGVYAGWPNENKAIFVHLPKTAGTSISKALGLPVFRHVPADDYLIANPKKFAQFFKFAFVRNPYDRLLSSYSFLKKGGMNSDDRQFAQTYVMFFESFEHFLIDGFASCPEIRAWIHFRPQATFICNASGGNQMDFTGRFESIAEDYAEVAARLGKCSELPVTNRSERGDYREAYTPAMIEIARRFYAIDLENFGYGFD